jgi:hypothetical protein
MTRRWSVRGPGVNKQLKAEPGQLPAMRFPSQLHTQLSNSKSNSKRVCLNSSKFIWILIYILSIFCLNFIWMLSNLCLNMSKFLLYVKNLVRI